MGRVRFQRFQKFNLSLLAKQWWRLLNNENSLVFKILKVKKFSKSFLDAYLGYNPSYTWRSLIANRKVLEGGLTRCIGNGASIETWKDTWLMRLENPRPFNFLNDEEFVGKVQDLILENKRGPYYPSVCSKRC